MVCSQCVGVASPKRVEGMVCMHVHVGLTRVKYLHIVHYQILQSFTVSSAYTHTHCLCTFGKMYYTQGASHAHVHIHSHVWMQSTRVIVQYLNNSGDGRAIKLQKELTSLWVCHSDTLLWDRESLYSTGLNPPSLTEHTLQCTQVHSGDFVDIFTCVVQVHTWCWWKPTSCSPLPNLLWFTWLDHVHIYTVYIHTCIKCTTKMLLKVKKKWNT